MKVKAYGHTDVGLKRDHNEDYLILEPTLGLFGVCDGMGGHAGGEIASATAAEYVINKIRESKDRIAAVKNFDEEKDSLVALMRSAVEEASREVYLLATSDKGKAGMGTTLTVMLTVRGRHGIMAHVGDSRLYLLRDETLHQLSEDHSYINEMIKRGMIDPAKAEQSPYANVITRAVGIQSSVQVDTLVFDILPGDSYLVCSDGLSRYFDGPAQDELTAILNANYPKELPERLCKTANDCGGKDNVTTVIVHAEGGDVKDQDAVRSTEVNLRLDTLRYISLFKHLTMKELVQVLDVAQPRTYQPGDEVVREGDRGSSLFLIMKGELYVTRGGAELTTLKGGSHFGEMSLLNARPRSATVTAKTRSKLLVLDRDGFNELVRREPTLGVKFLWTLSQVLSLRLDETNELLGQQPTSTTLIDEKSPFHR